MTVILIVGTRPQIENYSDLMTLLTSNSSDLRAVPLMVEYNVSYVYIGSTATTYSLEDSYRRQFNATQFLSTPYFTLSKEIGDAWLFQFNASAALAAYENYVVPDCIKGVSNAADNASVQAWF